MKHINIILLAATACAALIFATCKQMTGNKVTYSVTFKTNGGSSISAQTVESGKNAMKAVAPTKPGHIFDGWYSDENCTAAFDFATAITTNTILYAKWRVSPHTAGDILLDDGEWVLKKDVVTLDAETLGTRKAVGVFAFENKGKPYCVGLDIGKYKMWAKDGTLAYMQNITAIQEGDSYGGDNWNKIVQFYKKNEKTENDALADCAAFKWAKEYGDGWYIPNLYELRQVCNNKEAISYSLAMLFAIAGSGCKINGLEKAWYWTSNQVSSNQDSPPDVQAWIISFISGNSNQQNKNDEMHVIVVREFDY